MEQDEQVRMPVETEADSNKEQDEQVRTPVETEAEERTWSEIPKITGHIGVDVLAEDLRRELEKKVDMVDTDRGSVGLTVSATMSEVISRSVLRSYEEEHRVMHKNAQLQAQVESLLHQNAKTLETRKENLDLRRQKEQVETEMFLQKQRWDERNLALETELDKLSIQLQAERGENKNLKRDLMLIWSTYSACESVLNTVEDSQREAAKRFQLLQARADEGLRIRNEMETLRGNLETAHRRSKIMEAANEAKDAQIACLNTDCETAIKKYQSFSGSMRGIPDLEAKIRQVDEQNNDRNKTILELRLSNDKLQADHTKETAVLRNHIAELTSALKATQQEVEDFNARHSVGPRIVLRSRSPEPLPEPPRVQSRARSPEPVADSGGADTVTASALRGDSGELTRQLDSLSLELAQAHSRIRMLQVECVEWQGRAEVNERRAALSLAELQKLMAKFERLKDERRSEVLALHSREESLVETAASLHSQERLRSEQQEAWERRVATAEQQVLAVCKEREELRQQCSLLDQQSAAEKLQLIEAHNQLRHRALASATADKAAVRAEAEAEERGWRAKRAEEAERKLGAELAQTRKAAGEAERAQRVLLEELARTEHIRIAAQQEAAQRRAMEQRLQAVTAHLADATRQLEQERSRASRVGKMEAEVAGARTDTANLKVEEATLRERLRGAGAREAQLRGEKAEMAQRLAKAEGEVERLKGALNQSQRQLVEATRAAEKTVQEVRKTEMGLRRERESAEKAREECAALQAKLKTAATQVKTAEQQVKAAEKRTKELQEKTRDQMASLELQNVKAKLKLAHHEISR